MSDSDKRMNALKMEKGNGFRDSIRDVPKHFNLSTLGAGLTAAAFGLTGVPLLLIAAAEQGGLSSAEMTSWILAVYGMGGLLGIIMGLYYKKPIVGAWSIPGAVMLGPILADFDMSIAVGAYLMTGVIVFLVGVSGYFRKAVHLIPQPIIMGMIIGILIHFTIDIVEAVEASLIIGGVAFLGFVIFHNLFDRVPGIIGAIVFGAIAATQQGATQFGDVDLALGEPVFYTPAWSLDAMISIAIPLSIIIIGAENMQAIGVLQAEEYDPPINSFLSLSGIAGVITSFMGGHNANVAGPSTAITSSEIAGDKEGRYVASLVTSSLYGAFGLLAGSAVALSQALPGNLVAVLAGIAMIPVLLSAFEATFEETYKYRYGAFFALIIAMSDITIFNIGAAFWAIVGGIALSLVLEYDHWEFTSSDSSSSGA